VVDLYLRWNKLWSAFCDNIFHFEDGCYLFFGNIYWLEKSNHVRHNTTQVLISFPFLVNFLLNPRASSIPALLPTARPASVYRAAYCSWLTHFDDSCRSLCQNVRIILAHDTVYTQKSESLLTSENCLVLFRIKGSKITWHRSIPKPRLNYF